MPGIGWRDEQLAKRKATILELREHARTRQGRLEELVADRKELHRELGALEKELSKSRSQALAPGLVATGKASSFTRSLFEFRRTTAMLRTLDREHVHPLRQMPNKLHNYRLAMSHGVPVPEVFEVFANPASIQVDALPDRFVIKADGGAGSQGVLPLIRVGDDTYEMADGSKVYSAEGIRAFFAAQAAKGSVMAPYFAEEFLDQPGGGDIPDDIKIYAFYGNIGHTLLRRVGRHGDPSSVSRRYVDAQGNDVGQAMEGAPVDADIPLPANYEEMVEIARHLSRAIGTAFVRVDLYQTRTGPVLGELTRGPGGEFAYVPQVDQALGEAWDAARYYVDLDVAHGRPYGRLYGEHHAPNRYPPQHWSHRLDIRETAEHTQACGRWCGVPD